MSNRGKGAHRSFGRFCKKPQVIQQTTDDPDSHTFKKTKKKYNKNSLPKRRFDYLGYVPISLVWDKVLEAKLESLLLEENHALKRSLKTTITDNNNTIDKNAEKSTWISTDDAIKLIKTTVTPPRIMRNANIMLNKVMDDVVTKCLEEYNQICRDHKKKKVNTIHCFEQVCSKHGLKIGCSILEDLNRKIQYILDERNGDDNDQDDDNEDLDDNDGKNNINCNK